MYNQYKQEPVTTIKFTAPDGATIGFISFPFLALHIRTQQSNISKIIELIGSPAVVEPMPEDGQTPEEVSTWLDYTKAQFSCRFIPKTDGQDENTIQLAVHGKEIEFEGAVMVPNNSGHVEELRNTEYINIEVFQSNLSSLF